MLSDDTSAEETAAIILQNSSRMTAEFWSKLGIIFSPDHFRWEKSYQVQTKLSQLWKPI